MQHIWSFCIPIVAKLECKIRSIHIILQRRGSTFNPFPYTRSPIKKVSTVYLSTIRSSLQKRQKHYYSSCTADDISVLYSSHRQTALMMMIIHYYCCVTIQCCTVHKHHFLPPNKNRSVFLYILGALSPYRSLSLC